jgi:hypothetical protein
VLTLPIVQKPFDDDKLLALIHEQLGEPCHAGVGAG